MPLIEEEKRIEEVQERATIEKIEDIDPYLYLLDLVTALNSLSINAMTIENLLNEENIEIPSSLQKVFTLFREKEEFLESLRESMKKMELFKAAIEGAMLSTAAIEFSKRVFKEEQS